MNPCVVPVNNTQIVILGGEFDSEPQGEGLVNAVLNTSPL